MIIIKKINPRGDSNLACSTQKSTKQWATWEISMNGSERKNRYCSHSYLRVIVILLRASVEKERPNINPSAGPKNLEQFSNKDELERIIKSKGRLVHSYTLKQWIARWKV
jgi:hypothetical protein